MTKNLNAILISVIGSLLIAKIQPELIIYVIIIAFLILISTNIFLGSKDRIRIKSLRQNFFTLPYSIIFEAENIGDRPNSIRRTISMSCLLIPLKKTFLFGEKHKCTFTIKGNDRSLEPHKAKVFEAITTDQYAQLFVSKFRRFTIYPNRGRRAFIFSIGPSKRETNYFRFYMKRTLYQFLKRVPKNVA